MGILMEINNSLRNKLPPIAKIIWCQEGEEQEKVWWQQSGEQGIKWWSGNLQNTGKGKDGEKGIPVHFKKEIATEKNTRGKVYVNS